MKIDLNAFRVEGNNSIDLNDWPTNIDAVFDSKKQYKKCLAEQVKELSELQRLHYASNHYAVLLIFQAVDAAGKDGTIRHVMSGVNPQGCQVFSFKEPSTAELQHDFLWRTNKCLPERGRIGIFNRSYYEEVLVVRVHPELLAAEGFGDEASKRRSFWQERYASIRHLETHLYENHTRVLKFYLHLSKDEQARRFIKRIDKPNKNWKFSTADVKQREQWDAYAKAYGACISATASKEAPWYIVPADDKKNARLIVSQAILRLFKSLKMEYPAGSQQHSEELQAIRAQLADEIGSE